MSLPLLSIWNWFGLEVEPGAEWSIRWMSAPPAWVTLFIVIVPAALFVTWLYRRHQSPGSRARRLLLAGTRFFALLLIVLMLYDPILAVEKEVTRRSYVAVLVDDSLSMTFVDRYRDHEERTKLARAAGWIEGDAPLSPSAEVRLAETSRWELLKSIWARNEATFLKRLTEKHTVKLYSFGTRLRRDPKLGADAPSPEGAHTKVGDAIRDVLDDMKGQLVAGVIVLTDGRSNAGEYTPVEAAQAAAAHGRGVPVFTVGVGAPEVPRDLRLVQVRAPPVVLTDEQIQIEFTVSHNGFPGDRITAELHRDDAEGPIEADTTLQLVEQSNQPQRAVLKLKPFTEEGEYELVLHIPPDPEDTVPENNTKRLRIRVVDGKLKVLYVDGRPRFEYRHFSLALTRDERIAANVLLADSDVGVEQRHTRGVRPLAEFPRTELTEGGKRGLFDYDVLIIGDTAFAPREGGLGIFAEPQKQMKMVERFVEEVGGGVIFLAGPDANPGRFRDTPLATLLPVELLDSTEMGSDDHRALSDSELKPERTPAGKDHVLLQLHPDTSSNVPNDLLWRSLRGLWWTAPVRGTKLHAETLLQLPHAGPYGKRPVLVSMWYGRGRTVFVGTDEIWRWRELQGDRYYYRFFSNLIRFVGNNRLLGDERRFELTLEKSAFTLGERVVVRGKVWDEGFRKLRADSVDVQHETADGTPKPLTLEGVPDGKGGLRPGEFEGSFVAGRLGPHRLWFENAQGTRMTKAALVSFDVVVPQREMENPALDAATLQAVWDESKATAASVEARSKRETWFKLWELPIVATAVPDRNIVLSGVDTTHRLWDTWLVFALLLGLLCLEWIVRKLTRLP